MRFTALAATLILTLSGCASTEPAESPDAAGPALIVLGVAQDAGIPQAGAFDHPGWDDPDRRRTTVCLGLVDRRDGRRWMIEATPDFRDQLTRLHLFAGPRAGPAVDGIFITHAHIGHYTGLMFLGHESMGAHSVPVWAMPRMARFLETNGPWSQLVAKENIALARLTAGRAVELAPDLRVTPFRVPHRDEYSDTVGYRIDGPRRSVLFIPDIDSWHEWDADGTRIEEILATVDVAYVDGTFFGDGEIPGRDMSGFPHPFISTSIKRFAGLPPEERAKVRFIHLNHTNPAQDPTSAASRSVRDSGSAVAREGEILDL